MCLILFAYQSHPEYPLILAANRDEFYQRETRAAQWWPEAPHLLAGKDLEADGTWMGITNTGRLAAITNVREPQLTTPAACSRGLLTRRYLEEEIDESRFSSILQQTKDQYRGYNLLYGKIDQLHYFSNRNDRLTILEPGIYGLSNAQLDTPWPKVQTGKQLLKTLLEEPDLNAGELSKVLASTTIVPDNQLPETGVSLEWERKLSAICITGPDYGTRSSTALIVDRQGNVDFHETTRGPEPPNDKQFNFLIHK